MRKSTTDRMNDYDAVVMGALEPIVGDGGKTRSAFAYSTSRMDIEMTRSEWRRSSNRHRPGVAQLLLLHDGDAALRTA